MTPSTRLLSLVLVASVGCRARGPDHSTGVGNPGNLTVGMGPTEGVDLTRVSLALHSVTSEMCSGDRQAVQLDGLSLDLQPNQTIQLPSHNRAALDSGLCAIELALDGPLEVDGTGHDVNGDFALVTWLPTLEVRFDTPLDVSSDTILDLTLGRDGWLDAAWLGLQAGETVVVDASHPQHDAILGRLTTLALVDRQSGVEVATVEPDTEGLAMHIAAGGGGWMVGSFDDGRSWVELRAPSDGEPEDHLLAVAASSGRSGGDLFVAVGGETSGTVVVTDDGQTFETTTAPTLGLRDVAWLGDRFLAVGVEGRITFSSDGRTWDANTPLGDCHFNAVDVVGDRVLAAGVDNGGVGCVWLSTDHGESFNSVAGLPTEVFDLHATADGFVAIGDENKLSFASHDGGVWETVVLPDTFLHDVTVWDGWVKVLGDDYAHYTSDYETIHKGDTAGFTRWVPALDKSVLLAITEDGEVYRAPDDNGLDIDTWSVEGSFGRSEHGLAFADVAVYRP